MLQFYIILFHFKETIQIFSKIPTFPQNSYLFPTKIEEKAEIPTPSTFSDQCGHPGSEMLKKGRSPPSSVHCREGGDGRRDSLLSEHGIELDLNV